MRWILQIEVVLYQLASWIGCVSIGDELFDVAGHVQRATPGLPGWKCANWAGL